MRWNRGNCKVRPSGMETRGGNAGLPAPRMLNLWPHNWSTTKCLSSIFLRAKLIASWCTTARVSAEKPQPAVGLRPHRAEPEGQDGVSGHGNRPHAVL